jgi:hypothetical protein
MLYYFIWDLRKRHGGAVDEAIPRGYMEWQAVKWCDGTRKKSKTLAGERSLGSLAGVREIADLRGTSLISSTKKTTSWPVDQQHEYVIAPPLALKNALSPHPVARCYHCLLARVGRKQYIYRGYDDIGACLLCAGI